MNFLKTFLSPRPKQFPVAADRAAAAAQLQHSPDRDGVLFGLHLCAKHMAEVTADRVHVDLVDETSPLECDVCLKVIDPDRVSLVTDPTTGRKKRLGSGRPVYMGQLRYGTSEQRSVVVKVWDSGDMEEFWKELQIHSQLRHPNLVPLLGYTRKEDLLCLVLPFKVGGDLQQLIHGRNSRQPIPMSQIQSILSDMARGLDHLHAHGVIHRDLKPANVLLNSSHTQAYLADFGSTRFEASEMTCFLAGTVAYLAPEAFRGSRYTTAVDIYSFGVIAWELCTREQPWKDLKMPFAVRLEECLKHGQRPVIPADVCAPLRDVMERSWSQKPTDRPTASELMRWYLPRLSNSSSPSASPSASPSSPPTASASASPVVSRPESTAFRNSPTLPDLRHIAAATTAATHNSTDSPLQPPPVSRSLYGRLALDEKASAAGAGGICSSNSCTPTSLSGLPSSSNAHRQRSVPTVNLGPEFADAHSDCQAPPLRRPERMAVPGTAPAPGRAGRSRTLNGSMDPELDPYCTFPRSLSSDASDAIVHPSAPSPTATTTTPVTTPQTTKQTTVAA